MSRSNGAGLPSQRDAGGQQRNYCLIIKTAFSEHLCHTRDSAKGFMGLIWLRPLSDSGKVVFVISQRRN